MRPRAFAVVMMALVGCDSRIDVPAIPAPAAAAVAKASIVVTVLDATGEPIAGARVVPFPINRLLGKDDKNRAIAELYVSDATGKREVDGLPVPSTAGKPIAYTLFVYASGFNRGEVALEPFKPDERREVTVRLTPSKPVNSNRIALFDGENLARGTDFMVRSNLTYTVVTGALATTDLSKFDVFITGLDQSVNAPFSELVRQSEQLSAFVEGGGLYFSGQTNDSTWDPKALPVPITFLVENAPLNDFSSLVIRAPDHPLIAGLTEQDLTNWEYLEPIKNSRLTTTTFDAASNKNLDPRWVPILTAPTATESATLSAGGIEVPPEAGIALAEAHVGKGRVVLNQTAFYQGSLGELTTPAAIKLRDNVVRMLSGYVRP